jgi:hypothetical protein
MALFGLAIPAGALADGSGSEYIQTVKVKKNAGFKLSVLASKGNPTACGGPCPSSVGAFLVKHSGSGVGSTTQTNDYGLSSGITFMGSKNLSSAKVSGTFAKRRGSIRMTFHATKAATAVPVPKGCTGTPGKQRKGVLKGSFKLKADKLGTETLKSIRATFVKPPKITSCSPGHPSHGTSPGRLWRYREPQPVRVRNRAAGNSPCEREHRRVGLRERLQLRS